MTKLMTMLAAALLVGTASYGRTDTIPDTTAVNNHGNVTAEQRGDLARLHNENAQAVSFYREALREDRQNAALLNKLGVAQLQLGQRSPARNSFKQSLKLDPTSYSALSNLGAISLLEAKYKAAIEYFNRALALNETIAATHLNLAEAWMGQGDIDHATAEYARAVALDPDVLIESTGGVQAQTVSPAQRALASYLLAKTYMKRGNIDIALDYLAKAKDMHYADLAKVYADSDFAALWQDPRLAKIVAR
jgi:tetratricopeptide (TPR) repeat protein